MRLNLLLMYSDLNFNKIKKAITRVLVNVFARRPRRRSYVYFYRYSRQIDPVGGRM